MYNFQAQLAPPVAAAAAVVPNAHGNILHHQQLPTTTINTQQVLTKAVK